MWTQAALLQSQLLPSVFSWAGMILPCGRSAVCLGHHAGISELCEGVILWHLSAETYAENTALRVKKEERVPLGDGE